jgi:hypothetical protein
MALTSMWKPGRHLRDDATDVAGLAARSLLCGDGDPLGRGDIAWLTMLWKPAHPGQLDAQARHLLAEVWVAVAPPAIELPTESLRRGAGPRAGVAPGESIDRVRWSSSISHSAARPVVAAAVVVQPIDAVADGPRITIGVDVEPINRFVHPGVARMIAARADTESPLVASGAVPLLAVACVKEAIYKADPLQSGRMLADYAWIEARGTEDAGWCGTVTAVGDCTQCFTVAVCCVAGNWLAVALAER